MKTNQLQTNIPDGWKFHKLDDLLTFVVDNRGKTPPIQSSGIPMAEVNAIGDKNIKYSEITKFVSEETYKTWFRKHLEKNDILFSTVGRTASCSIYTADIKTVIAQNLIGLRFGKDNPEFMFYLLTQDKNNQEFKNIEMSAAQPSVKVSQMIHLEFLVPPLPEQNRIVSVLETWDKLIEKIEQKIKTKKQIKKALMQDLLSGKKRLSGFNEKWETRKLRECLTIRHGKPQKEVESPDGKYPILGTGGEFGRATKFLYDKPSVLIGRKGTIDKPKYIDTPFWTVDTLFYTEIKKSIDPKFLYYIFLTINWKLYNEGSGVPSLSASTISSIKVSIPKEEKEQKAIANILTTSDEEITELEKKLSIIKEQKRYLINNLIAGTIRTPETLSSKLTK